jgi:cation transport ATPase
MFDWSSAYFWRTAMDLSPQKSPEQLPDFQALLPVHPPEVKSLDVDQWFKEYLKNQGVEPSSFDISITKKSEPEAEMRFRHQQAIEERRHQQRKEYFNYGLGMILVTVLVTASILLMTSPKASSDTQGWARTTLTSVATAVAGYMFGSKDKEKK